MLLKDLEKPDLKIQEVSISLSGGINNVKEIKKPSTIKY